MAPIVVEPEVLAGAGVSISAVGDELAAALSTLAASLPNGAMAGHDTAGLAFGKAYKQAGQALLNAGAAAVNGGRKVGFGVQMSATNYSRADASSTIGGGAGALTPPSAPGEVDAPTMSSPFGGGVAEPFLWSMVEMLVGSVWPDGDPTQLRAAANAWSGFARTLAGVAGQLGDDVGNAVATVFDTSLNMREGLLKGGVGALEDLQQLNPLRFAYDFEGAKDTWGGMLETQFNASVAGAIIDPQRAAETQKEMLKGLVHAEDWTTARPGLGAGENLFDLGSLLFGGAGAARSGTRAAGEAADVAEGAAPGVRAAGALDNAVTDTSAIAGRAGSISDTLDNLGENIPSGATPNASGPSVPSSLTEPPSAPRVPEAPSSRVPDTSTPHTEASPTPHVPDSAPADRSPTAPHSSTPTSTPAHTPAAPGDGTPGTGTPRIDRTATAPTNSAAGHNIPSQAGAGPGDGTPSANSVPSGGNTSAATVPAHAPDPPPPTTDASPTVPDSSSRDGQAPDTSATDGSRGTDVDNSDSNADDSGTNHGGASDADRQNNGAADHDPLGQNDADEHPAFRPEPAPPVEGHDYGFSPENAFERLQNPADEIQRLHEGGVPAKITDGYDPLAGRTIEQFRDEFTVARQDGSLRWDWNNQAPNNGFAGPPTITDRVPDGYQLDRLGSNGGAYMADEGAPLASRGMPPGVASDYHRFVGTGEPIPDGLPWEVQYGPAKEAFGQPGGANQWVVIDKTNGEEIPVEILKQNGMVDEIRPPIR
jgi:hypothetical protein